MSAKLKFEQVKTKCPVILQDFYATQRKRKHSPPAGGLSVFLWYITNKLNL